MKVHSLAAMLAATSCIMVLGAPAHAQQRAFDIPAGSLGTALDAFGRQSGRPIIYKAEEVRGVRSPGYRGSASPQKALEAILDGLGFVARVDTSGAIALVRLQPAVSRISQVTTPDALGATGSAPNPDGSPDAQAAQDSAPLGDIIVTAQRRSENLQKVPISVQAVRADTLASVGVQDVSSIQVVVPGVVIQRIYAGAAPFIRGIGSTSSGFTAEPSVATYIDGFYLPNQISALFAFNNIERIEVLKGPQGTLFGRNVVGGLIQVVTRDPPSSPKVEGSLGYGSYDTIDAKAYAGTGLTESLAMDVGIVYHDQRDGWGRNVFTGSDIYKDREFSFISKMKWTPTNSTTVTLRGFYNYIKSDQATAIGVFPGSFGTDGTPYQGKYLISVRKDPAMRGHQYNVGLRIEQDIGRLSLVSLTGYNYAKNSAQYTQNGILGQPITGRGATNNDSRGHSENFMQEIQLLSNNDSPIRWIVGGFFMKEHYRLITTVLPTCVNGVCSGSPPPRLLFSDQELKSYAAFGEATVDIADNTRVTLGLRYTSDHKDISASFTAPLPGFPTSVPSLPPPVRPLDPYPGNPLGVDPTKTFSELTWRAVLAHDFTPDIMAYASVNRGFKSGAFSTSTFNNPPANPEILDAYEIGLKTQLFDRRLRFNLAGFYYDYDDIQLRTSAPPAPPGTTITFNAAGAKIKGANGEITFQYSPALSLMANFEYLHAKYSDFPAASCSVPRPRIPPILGGTTSFNCNLTGHRLPRAPKLTTTVTVNYRYPTPIGEFLLTVNDAYNSGFFWTETSRLRQKSYHRLNASMTWTANDDRWSIQLYGRNLNKPYYFINALEGASGVDVYAPGEPRTFGVRVGFKL